MTTTTTDQTTVSVPRGAYQATRASPAATGLYRIRYTDRDHLRALIAQYAPAARAAPGGRVYVDETDHALAIFLPDGTDLATIADMAAWVWEQPSGYRTRPDRMSQPPEPRHKPVCVSLTEWFDKVTQEAEEPSRTQSAPMPPRTLFVDPFEASGIRPPVWYDRPGIRAARCRAAWKFVLHAAGRKQRAKDMRYDQRHFTTRDPQAPKHKPRTVSVEAYARRAQAGTWPLERKRILLSCGQEGDWDWDEDAEKPQDVQEEDRMEGEEGVLVLGPVEPVYEVGCYGNSRQSRMAELGRREDVSRGNTAPLYSPDEQANGEDILRERPLWEALDEWHVPTEYERRYPPRPSLREKARERDEQEVQDEEQERDEEGKRKVQGRGWRWTLPNRLADPAEEWALSLDVRAEKVEAIEAAQAIGRRRDRYVTLDRVLDNASRPGDDPNFAALFIEWVRDRDRDYIWRCLTQPSNLRRRGRKPSARRSKGETERAAAVVAA